MGIIHINYIIIFMKKIVSLNHKTDDFDFFQTLTS